MWERLYIFKDKEEKYFVLPETADYKYFKEELGYEYIGHLDIKAEKLKEISIFIEK